MKKLFAFLLVACMMLSISMLFAGANEMCEAVEYRDADGNPIEYETYSVTAHDFIKTTEPQNGNVPKVDEGIIKIDGKRDDAYLQALRVNCTRMQGGDEADLPTGEAWVVYDDSYLYAFVTVYDHSPFHIADKVTICDQCGKQRGQSSKCEHMGDSYDMYNDHAINMWDDDCIEMMVDWTNDGSVPGQYRISRDGFMSRDWDTWNTGFSGKGYDWSKTGEGDGSSWCAEFALALDSSAEGTQLGLTFMLHSMTSLYDEGSYRETYAMMNSSTCTGGPWDATYFDYITLGARIEVEEIDDDKKPDDGFGEKGGETSGETGNTNTETGSTTTTTGTAQGGNKPTGDSVVLVVLAAVAALGAAVVVKKTCFNK